MPEELTIRKDRVRKAAKACPDAKKILQELFPEAFGTCWSQLEPGMVWRHSGEDYCYVFLGSGRQIYNAFPGAFGQEYSDSVFYSVRLNEGIFVSTNKDACNIALILKRPKVI